MIHVMASSDKVKQTTTTSTEINYCRVVYADKRKASQVVPVSNIYRGKRRKRRLVCTGEFLKRYLANPNENATLRVKEYIPEDNIINYHKVCIIACAATEDEANKENCSTPPLGRGKRIAKKKNFSDSPFMEQSPVVRTATQQGRKVEPKELTEEQQLSKLMKRERKTKKESLAEIMLGVESTEEIKPTLKFVRRQLPPKIGEAKGNGKGTFLDGNSCTEINDADDADDNAEMAMSARTEWRDEPGFGPESTLKSNGGNDSMHQHNCPTDERRIVDAVDTAGVKKKLFEKDDSSDDNKDDCWGDSDVENKRSNKQVLKCETAGRKLVPVLTRIALPTEEEEAHCKKIISAVHAGREKLKKELSMVNKQEVIEEGFSSDKNNSGRTNDGKERKAATLTENTYDFLCSTIIESGVDNSDGKKSKGNNEEADTGNNNSVPMKRFKSLKGLKREKKKNDNDLAQETIRKFRTNIQMEGKEETSEKSDGLDARKDDAKPPCFDTTGTWITDGCKGKRNIPVTVERHAQLDKQAQQRRKYMESFSREELIRLVEEADAKQQEYARYKRQFMGLINEIRMSGPDWENIDQRVRQIEDPDPNAEVSAVLHDLPEETEEGTVTVVGKKWNYKKFREAAQTHKDTTRIVALAKALWPNVEIRKRMRLKIRSNSPPDSIEINLKDIMAIKSAAEQLDGIRNLQMKENCKLKKYKDTIGNMIKCLRNRSKNSEGNATRNLREDADTRDTSDADNEEEDEEEEEERKTGKKK